MTAKFDIAKLRLHAQQLAQPNLVGPAEIVGWFGAVQAQDYAGAKWSLAQRMCGLNAMSDIATDVATDAVTDAGIEQAFNNGEIIRTHILRPTWHFVHPADLRWMLMLSAPRVHALSAPHYRKEGLDEASLARGHAVLRQALQGNHQLTRDALRATVIEAGMDMQSNLRMIHLLMHAELEGLICSGGRRGKQFTYALLDERIPATRKWTRDSAVAELAKRYFRSHGPATIQDFVWWSGLTVADAKQGIALAGDALSMWAVGDKTYWFDAALPTMVLPSRKAYLLPTYDEYLLSYVDRSASLDPEIAHIWNGWDDGELAFSSSIVIAGQVVGVWRRTLRKRAVQIETKFLRSLTKAEEKAFHEATERFGEFLGVEVVLSADSVRSVNNI